MPNYYRQNSSTAEEEEILLLPDMSSKKNPDGSASWEERDEVEEDEGAVDSDRQVLIGTAEL